MWASYSTTDRETVLRRIFSRIDNDRTSLEQEGRPLYRSKQTRRQQLKTDKSTWFREMGATTTIMVPSTKDSTLAKRLREVVVRYPGPKGTVIKVMEKPGKPLMAGLRPDPQENTECYRENCPLIRSGQECQNRCRVENILYTAHCTKCHDRQEDQGIMPELMVEALYIGETSRTLGVRSGQHLEDYRRCQRQTDRDLEGSSFMWDHHLIEHPEDQIDPDMDFQWRLLDRMKDPMTRQIRESVRIEDALSRGIHHTHQGMRRIKSLNRKEEHFQARKRPEYNQ